jgi:hypothetical protein
MTSNFVIVFDGSSARAAPNRQATNSMFLTAEYTLSRDRCGQSSA